MHRTSRSDLLNLWKTLGVCRGSTVMVHSALFSLGLIEGGVSGVYETLLEIVREEGTIIVPAFTYSFRRNQCFDIRNTPSARNIGIFSEYVRMLPDSIRSADPYMSMAAIGPRAEELMKRDSINCFGEGSIYEKLFNDNVLFIAIGINYSTGLTGFLHLEKLANIPYRKDLYLKGLSVNYQGEEFEDEVIHFACDEQGFGEVITNRDPIGEKMEDAGISKSLKWGYGQHIALYGQGWKDFVLEALQQNPYTMLD